MMRVMIAGVLAAACALPAFVQAKEDKPKEKPGEPIEKIDPSVDRSITGIVESVEAKDANNGKLTLRSSGPAKGSPYQYIFQVDEKKTKLETAEGKPLSDGLKSKVLTAGAEVRVEFVDEKRGGQEPPPGVHFARKIQIIQPAK